MRKDNEVARIKLDEAISICEEWFRHLDRQAQKAVTLQKAASLARAGKIDEARRLKNTVDRAPKVYDGARLRPAVEHLIAALDREKDDD